MERYCADHATNGRYASLGSIFHLIRNLRVILTKARSQTGRVLINGGEAEGNRQATSSVDGRTIQVAQLRI